MRDETADRLAVRDLIDRYSDAITRRDFDYIGTLFSENGVWRAGPPFNIRLEGPAIAQVLGAALAPFEFLVQTPLGSVIELGDDHAKARTMIYEMGQEPDGVVNEMGPFRQYGLYEDMIARIGGKWLFQSRHFHPLYREHGPLPGTTFKLELAGER